ncbi:unnamed protein product [Tilletia caries]|uniref:Uncharacterized protein n=3 Tax=Tilletia TaxID=13289 RepID=A0ABN7J715_9BASI|nr:unnamed protein product [Tilletia caries]
MYPNRALPGIKGEGHHIDFWSEEPEQYHTEADLTVRPDEPLETVAVKASKIAEILQAGVYLSAQDEQLGSNSEEHPCINWDLDRDTFQPKKRASSTIDKRCEALARMYDVPVSRASIENVAYFYKAYSQPVPIVTAVAKIIGAERNAGGQSLRGRQEYVLAKRLRAHMATRINDIQRWSNQREAKAILKDVERTMQALHIRIGSLAPAPEEFRKAGWSVEDSLGQVGFKKAVADLRKTLAASTTGVNCRDAGAIAIAEVLGPTRTGGCVARAQCLRGRGGH